jgi:HEAT repeat protein
MTLVGALADKEPFVRWQAGRTLASLGSRAALDVLLQALRTPPVARQAAAADSLGTLGDRGAVSALQEAARSQHVGLRASAIEALGRLGGDDAAPLYLEKLRDEAAGVRRAAAWALGELRDSSATDSLVVRLGDAQEHVLVRRTAAWALGRVVPDSIAVAQLVKALEDPDAQVRWNAAQALGRAGASAVDERVLDALRARLEDQGQALEGQVSQIVQQTYRRLRRRSRLHRLLRWRRPQNAGS